MSWTDEAIEILKGVQSQCTTKEDAIRYVSVSIIEIMDLSGINIHDIKQFMNDLIDEIDSPTEEETEPEEPIIEVGINGVFDS